MELVVLKGSLPYGGKTYRRGQRFTALDAHARLLILVKAAAEAPGYAREDLEAEAATGSARSAQQYARRDLEVETIGAPAPVKRKRGRPPKVRKE